MNNFSFNSQSEKDVNSPTNEVTPQLSYFDVISNRLNAWEVKQQTIREAKAQLTKSFLIKDTDTITGINKTFKLTIELVSTEVDAQQHQLELMEMEGDYVS